MFLITKPSEEIIRQFINEQKGKSFSYKEVGSTRGGNAPGIYTVDHDQVRLGTGRAAFDRAIEALRNRKMFDLSWTGLYFDDTPMDVKTTDRRRKP